MTRTIYCSFCGRDNSLAGPMMESTDQTNKAELCRICHECAQIAIRMLGSVRGSRGTTRARAPNEIPQAASRVVGWLRYRMWCCFLKSDIFCQGTSYQG